MKQRYVLFMLVCGCGTKLQVYAERTPGGFQSRHVVICQKCQRQHEIPTRPRHFFYQVGEYWTSGPVD